MVDNQQYTFISIEMPRDTYFLIMEACLITRQTFDEFIIGAALNAIKENKEQLSNDEAIKSTDEGNPNEPLTRRKEK